MSTRFDITLPNGRQMPVFWNEGQSKMEIVRDMLLPGWEEYCLRHWMGNGEQTESEQRIKRFLDGCAYILLRDNNAGTLTNYKEMMIGSREISASACPACIADILEGGGASLCMGDEDEIRRFETMLEVMDERAGRNKKKVKRAPKQKRESRFERIECIRREYPGCKLSMPLPVDVEGVFIYDNVRYRIDERCEAYRPRKTRYGEQYDMDHVTVVETADKQLRFYDQSIR